MSDDRAAPLNRRPASIRTPDQLQQAKRPDGSRAGGAGAARRDARGVSTAGILRQLETERAHD